MHTFYDLQTGPESVIERFTESLDDFVKFDAAFQNRRSYTKPIHGLIKDWVEENIHIWRSDKEDWFHEDDIWPEILPEREYNEVDEENR